MGDKKKLKDYKIHLTLDPYDLAWAASLGAVFVVMLELFYRMIVDYNGRYESDIQYYVTENVQEGVPHDRLLSIIFQGFYDINRGTLEANVYLAGVIVLLIIVNYLAIRYFVKSDGFADKVSRHAMQLFSVAMLFIGPIYMPLLHEYYYKKSFASFAWHSPTQQSMTLAALVAAVCFIELYMTYEEKGIRPWLWIATMLATLISTGFKPSYTIDLCLAIAVMFVVDLIRGGKEGFVKRLVNLFIIGCTTVPSGLYMIWLHTREFTEGEQFGEEHQVIFDISHVLEYDGLLAAVIFGITVPIIVFAFDHSRFKDKKYRFVLYIFIMGIVQWALVTETGTRGNFGNFTWGRIFGCYFLTIAACSVLLEVFYDRDLLGRGSKKRKAFIVLTCIALMLSICSQLNYFRLILTGHGYML